jgi:Fur family ferric uptake transcriptional regulator
MEERKFKEFLKAKGLKFTNERRLILREVLSRKGHFDLEELYISMRTKGLKVSKASVYRTLPLLIECSLIEQVEKTEKHAHYECTVGGGHHDHMLCVSCGRVIEFYSGALEKLQERLCREEGFRGITHTLEIKGCCKRCMAKSKKAAP